MTSGQRVSCRVVEVLALLSGLMFRQSCCEVSVTVRDIQAYSAIMQWDLVIPLNTTVTGFNILVQGEHSVKTVETIEGDAATFIINDLDDMRAYNACVVTLVSPGGVAETGCSSFTTPAGASTYLAIASGVFLLLCFIIFSILDFVVNSKTHGELSGKEDELLEQGWQTFKRNSRPKKKKQKMKNREAPRPPSTEVASAKAPSSDKEDNSQM